MVFMVQCKYDDPFSKFLYFDFLFFKLNKWISEKKFKCKIARKNGQFIPTSERPPDKTTCLYVYRKW